MFEGGCEGQVMEEQKQMLYNQLQKTRCMVEMHRSVWF